jgi:hypothetical protein
VSTQPWSVSAEELGNVCPVSVTWNGRPLKPVVEQDDFFWGVAGCEAKREAAVVRLDPGQSAEVGIGGLRCLLDGDEQSTGYRLPGAGRVRVRLRYRLVPATAKTISDGTAFADDVLSNEVTFYAQ